MIRSHRDRAANPYMACNHVFPYGIVHGGRYKKRWYYYKGHRRTRRRPVTDAAYRYLKPGWEARGHVPLPFYNTVV